MKTVNLTSAIILTAAIAAGCGEDAPDAVVDAASRADAWVMPTVDGGGSGGPSEAGAGDAGGTPPPPPPCEITAPSACPDPPVRYADIEDVVNQRCVVCHFGAVGGPWPLNSHRHLVDWQDTIRTAMLECLMPPPESGMRMPDAERLLILQWLRCGVLP